MTKKPCTFSHLRMAGQGKTNGKRWIGVNSSTGCADSRFAFRFCIRRSGQLEIAHLIHGGLDDEDTDIVALVIDGVDEEAGTVELITKG